MWYKLTGMYIGNQKIRPNGWKPWANTLLYLPLNSTDTYTDQSWNSVVTTNNGTTFWTNYWVDCGYFNSSNIQVTTFTVPSAWTILCWCYNTWTVWWDGHIIDIGSSTRRLLTSYDEWWPWYWALSDWDLIRTTWFTYQNQWILYAFTFENGAQNLIIKWNSIDDSLPTTYSFSSFTPTAMNVWNEWNNWATRYFLGWMSNLIFEDKAWTATEINNYYDQTKWNYWIS